MELLAAVVQLLAFLTQPSQLQDNAEEAALLQIIGRRLSENEQMRLGELLDRRKWVELTRNEHEEMIRYEDVLAASWTGNTPLLP